MSLDFRQIMKRAGLLMGEMPPIKSGMGAVSAAKQFANALAGRNYVLTICDGKTFINFSGLIAKNPVKPGQTKSNQIQPNPTKKLAWTVPAQFKTATEACNP